MDNGVFVGGPSFPFQPGDFAAEREGREYIFFI